MFRDRHDAGRQLSERLLHLKGRDAVVLALPRGGVPVATEGAQALHAPVDIVLVRKIGAPRLPELAIAAVVDGPEPHTAYNRDIIDLLHIPDAYIDEKREQQLEEIARRRKLYLKGRPRIKVAGRTAIIVDDGIATGATVRAAIDALRQAEPTHLVLAVPAAPPEVVTGLQAEVDELVCLESPPLFGAISRFYLSFPQLDDTEVVRLLDEAAAALDSDTKAASR
jgi:putative phosphoribosyl transferase